MAASLSFCRREPRRCNVAHLCIHPVIILQRGPMVFDKVNNRVGEEIRNAGTFERRPEPANQPLSSAPSR
jgi:predicted transglutaminase-like cysteine proteinase